MPSDPNWGGQYRTPRRLNDRINLHRRYSTNPQGWFNWLADVISLQPGEHVLELGCGPGDFWRENLSNLPSNGVYTLSDRSPGMAASACATLEKDSRFRILVADAQALPLANAAYDVVIANHMLYHVPDISRAVAEMARLVKPGGRVIAATNGAKTMPELEDLIQSLTGGHVELTNPARRFSIENGLAYMEAHFVRVSLLHYQDSLWVTEAAHLADYIFSLSYAERILAGIDRADLEAVIRQHINIHGGFHISKSAGVFFCQETRIK